VLFDNHGNDIRSEKIYFRHGFYRYQETCKICGTKLGCVCYSDLETAIYEKHHVSTLCNEHLIREIWSDCAEIIDAEVPELGFIELYQEYIEITDYSDDAEAHKCIMGKIISALNKLTDAQLANIICGFDDGDEIVGKVCER